jgi:hypothetical protein
MHCVCNTGEYDPLWRECVWVFLLLIDLHSQENRFFFH